jgi:hypothetical protein
MPSRIQVGLSPARIASGWSGLLWSCLEGSGALVADRAAWWDCLALGRPRSAFTAASSILSSAKLTGWAARWSCLTGLGVTTRVAVWTGWAAFLTVRRAFFRGFGANSRQSRPIPWSPSSNRCASWTRDGRSWLTALILRAVIGTICPGAPASCPVPNLQIRKYPRGRPVSFRSVRHMGRSAAECSSTSGGVVSCPPRWLPSWLPPTIRFHPHVPSAKDTALKGCVSSWLS